MIGESPFPGAAFASPTSPITKGCFLSALPQFGTGLSPDSEPVPGAQVL